MIKTQKMWSMGGGSEDPEPDSAPTQQPAAEPEAEDEDGDKSKNKAVGMVQSLLRRSQRLGQRLAVQKLAAVQRVKADAKGNEGAGEGEREASVQPLKAMSGKETVKELEQQLERLQTEQVNAREGRL